MKPIQCQRVSVTERLRLQRQQSAKFSIFARLKSFGYAFNGIVLFFKTGHNAKLHALAAAIAVSLSVYCCISKLEWILVTVCICLVVITEMINTAIERAMDFMSRDYHYEIKVVKDIAAGAVLLTSLGSLVAGCIIFIPKIIMR